MSGNRNWRLSWKQFDLGAVRDAAALIVGGMEGVRSETERDAPDTLSVFFRVDDQEDPYTVELSLYDLGRGTVMLSLEAEWSDNHQAWDAACEFAEEMAEQLGASEVDLDS